MRKVRLRELPEWRMSPTQFIDIPITSVGTRTGRVVRYLAPVHDNFLKVIGHKWLVSVNGGWFRPIIQLTTEDCNAYQRLQPRTDQ